MTKNKGKILKQAEPQSLPAGHNKFFGTPLIILAFGIIISILTIPNLLLMPSFGIDNSWAIGLVMAIIRGMQFGKDIIFTFGPLGFIYTPVFCEFYTWLISASVTLSAHLLLIYLLVLTMKKMSAELKDYILPGAALLFALPIMSVDYKLLFSVLIILYLTITKPPDFIRLLTMWLFVSFLMATVSLIKFPAMVISISILLFMFVLCIYKKKMILFCCMLSGYIVSILLLLIITRQKITNFPAYLQNSIELSNGYNYAMMLVNTHNDIYIGVCVVILLLVLLLYSIIKKIPNLKYFIFISSGFFYVSFKHGFVRGDNIHVCIFFANAVLMLTYIYVTNKKLLNASLRYLTPALIFILIILIIDKSGRTQIIRDTAGKIKTAGSAIAFLTDSTAEKAQKLENAKKELRKAYSLHDDILKAINNSTIDVMPTEIALAFAYDLKWSPCPIFQSYSAYTAKLDTLNAQYLESPNAPQFIMYGMGSVTGRNQALDTPATFRAIMLKYRPIMVFKDSILFQKINVNFSEPILISTVDTEIDKPIAVPKIENGLLFAKIYMDYSFAGRIAKLFYKPAPVFIEFAARGGGRFEHFLVFPAAQNGIFLSQNIADIQNFSSVWLKKPANNLAAIYIFPSEPKMYDKHIRVEFLHVP